MTDYEKLRKIQKELPEDAYFRKNVLIHLFYFVDIKTKKLKEVVLVPQMEIDDDFLKDVLEDKLGYKTHYEDEYNPYWEVFCYKIHLQT